MPKPKGYKELDTCGICRFVFMYTEFGGDDPRFVCELNMPEDMPKPNRDHDDLHLFSCMMSDEEWNRWWKFAEENQVKTNGVCDSFLKRS